MALRRAMLFQFAVFVGAAAALRVAPLGPRHRLPPLPRCCISEAPTAESRTAAPATDELLKAAAPTVVEWPEIRRFATPALALWMVNPLLSLIDTSTVGLSARAGEGALQLAALGPATTFCDGAAYLFAFLNIATTNLYAAASAGVEAAAADPAASKQALADREALVRCAAATALKFGFGALTFLGVLAPALLRLYVGGGAAASLLDQATVYVRLRMLALPAVLLGGVIQAALLGARDSMSALAAAAIGALANVVFDFVLVVQLRRGLAGAAVATAFASCLSSLVLLRTAARALVPQGGLWRRPRAKTVANAGGEAASEMPSGKTTSGEAPPGEAPSSQAPSSLAFLGFAAPVLTLILGKLACFGFMTHAAAALGDEALAAHQLALTLFFTLSPLLEVISQTSQAFLPRYEADQPDASARGLWRAEGNRLAARLLRLATATGVFASALGGAVLLFGASMLTKEASVVSAAYPLARPLALALLLTGPVCAGEGVLLARRQLGFLAGVYASSTAVLPFLLLRIKRSGPVSAVWSTFALFQLVRAGAFTARVWIPELWRCASARANGTSELV